MAISISVIEAAKQIIANIPEYISIAINGVSNAVVYYTFDGSNPDITGNSTSTLMMEHKIGDPLHGTIFLPTHNNFLDLNILAVGVDLVDTATFYRRYGLDNRADGITRIGTTKPPFSISSYVNVPSANIDPITGLVIASDGYTEGSIKQYNIAKSGYDGYVDGYGVATSGQLTSFPPPIYDHIDGYIAGDNNDISGYSTTTLTFEQEQKLLKLSDRGDIFVDDGRGLVKQPDTFREIDPRSSTIVDRDGRQIEIVPIEDYPLDGYTIDVGARTIDINYDNAPKASTTFYTSGGMFNPRASYIEIDGRIDGYINGQPILPGDAVVINKPFGELRYDIKKENAGSSFRKPLAYLSGGLSCVIHDYNKGQSAFYYYDNFDNRYVVSLQTLTPPKYELFAKRNGVVIGYVFAWITGKRQIQPG